METSKLDFRGVLASQMMHDFKYEHIWCLDRTFCDGSDVTAICHDRPRKEATVNNTSFLFLSQNLLV